MKIRTILRISTWALIFDSLSALSFSCAILNSRYRAILIIGIVASLIFLFNGVRLHSHFTARVRTLNILIAKNRTKLREDTFAEFMYAPCGRLLVKEALDTLGLPDEYARVAKRHPLFSRSHMKHRFSLEIVPYTESSGEKNDIPSI